MAMSKKMTPMPRVVRPRSTPVPLPQRTLKRPPGAAIPVPMPTIGPNYGKPRVTQRPKPGNPKKTPSPKLEMLPKQKQKGNNKVKGTPVRKKMI